MTITADPFHAEKTLAAPTRGERRLAVLDRMMELGLWGCEAVVGEAQIYEGPRGGGFHAPGEGPAARMAGPLAQLTRAVAQVAALQAKLEKEEAAPHREPSNENLRPEADIRRPASQPRPKSVRPVVAPPALRPVKPITKEQLARLSEKLAVIAEHDEEAAYARPLIEIVEEAWDDLGLGDPLEPLCLPAAAEPSARPAPAPGQSPASPPDPFWRRPATGPP